MPFPSEYDPMSPHYARSPLERDPNPGLTALYNLLRSGGGDPSYANAIGSIIGGLQSSRGKDLSDASRIGYFGDPNQKVIRQRDPISSLLQSIGVVGEPEPESMTPDEQYMAQLGSELHQQRQQKQRQIEEKQAMDLYRLLNMETREERQQKETRAEGHETRMGQQFMESLGQSESHFQQSQGLQQDRINALEKHQADMLKLYKRDRVLQEKRLKVDIIKTRLRKKEKETTKQEKEVKDKQKQVLNYVRQTVIPLFSDRLRALRQQEYISSDPIRVKEIKRFEKAQTDMADSMGSILGVPLDEETKKLLSGEPTGLPPGLTPIQ